MDFTPLGLGRPEAEAEAAWNAPPPKFSARAAQHTSAAAATLKASFLLGSFAVIINTAHISFPFLVFASFLCAPGQGYAGERTKKY